jgi:hypothetical protein
MKILVLNTNSDRAFIANSVEEINDDLYYNDINDMVYYEIDKNTYNTKRKISKDEIEEMLRRELYDNYKYLSKHPEMIRDNIKNLNSEALLMLNRDGKEVTTEDLYNYVEFDNLSQYRFSRYLEKVGIRDREEEIISKTIDLFNTEEDPYRGELALDGIVGSDEKGRGRDYWLKKIFMENSDKISTEAKAYMSRHLYRYEHVTIVKQSVTKEELEQYFKIVNVGRRNFDKQYYDEEIFKNLDIIDKDTFDDQPFEVKQFLLKGNSIMAGNVTEFKERIKAYMAFVENYLTKDNYEDYLGMIREFIENTVDNIEFYRIKKYFFTAYSDGMIDDLNKIVAGMILETFNNSDLTHGLTLKALVKNYIVEFEKDVYTDYSDNLFNYDFINDIPDGLERYKNVVKKVKLEQKLDK